MDAARFRAARLAQAGFQHNGRVAVALVPSLIVLAGFGGKVPVGIMLVRSHNMNMRDFIVSNFLRTVQRLAAN